MQKTLVNEINDIAKNNPESYIIWCGENAWLYRILEILNTVGIKVETVIDNSPLKQGIKTDYYEIKNFDYVKEIKGKAIFFICNVKGMEMVAQLKNLGIDRKNIYIFKPIEYVIEKFHNDFLYNMYDKERLTHIELQRTILDILIFFRDFCEQHHLRYYLYDGTLIGAVRHNGFIPWDDDIDVAMPYEDFLEFSRLFSDSKKYSLITWDRDDDYEFSLPRIVNNNTAMIIPGNTIIGCYLDIFPLGGYPDTEKEIVQKWNQYKEAEEKWHRFYVLKDTHFAMQDIRQDIIDGLHKISFDDATNVGVMRSERQKQWVAPKEWFEKSIKMSFCGQYFNVPVGYEYYLRMKYGDYMKIPDVPNRDIHGFKVWKL